ncbi:MAG: deoxyguanosinetriphosphate triphosphohydrolase [Rickettsiales bacterium]
MENALRSYACDPMKSKGRLYKTEKAKFRNDFQRDLNRITRSASFRRLEYKTQVFVNDKGDHYRTRLTHSIEVSQIGQAIASALKASVDLTEVICLSHDLGHPPFGHAGEEALNKKMQAHGGFDHNANSLKLVTEQEERYFDFDGLNLTWESIEGIVKHNGPLLGKYSDGKKVSQIILDFDKKFNLQLDRFASIEAQIAAIADDIAYNAHDLEDGMRAGLFTIEDIRSANFMNEILDAIQKKSNGAEKQRVIHEILRRVTDELVDDVIANSLENIEKLNIKTVEDIRNATQPIVTFSENKTSFIDNLRSFLLENMYKHSYVNRMTYRARKIVSELFDVYINNLECLPDNWYSKVKYEKQNPYIVVCDYIAGMTDRFAAKEHEYLCNF